jgi:aminoglycoside phosphotransferase (APT) family kinase protein
MNPLRSNPVLSDTAEARALSGLSAAEVFLVTRDGRHWFVRKAARQADASARLRRQVEKQQRFAALLADDVRTPRVLGDGEVDGRYFYDMEMIRGQDGASYLRQASYREVGCFADRLCRYLERAAAEPALLPNATDSLFAALFAKLHDVQAATGLISTDNLARLFLSLERVRRLGPILPTLCHGDLTLENMVLGHDGTIWVVDLLDAPFEHYWQDLAKLHQDLSGGWFLLRQPPVAQCVLDYLSQRLIQAATALHPAYLELHQLLTASTFVRILPYARDEREREFLRERIDYFARRVASNCGPN